MGLPFGPSKGGGVWPRASAVILAMATANAIDNLPPELLRKGRFDEIFFVDLPDESTRAEIFHIHLRRRGMASEALDVAALAAASVGFSGAEIEQVVVGARYRAAAETPWAWLSGASCPGLIEALSSAMANHGSESTWKRGLRSVTTQYADHRSSAFIAHGK